MGPAKGLADIKTKEVIAMNRILQGRHRLDMIPGNPATNTPTLDPIFYWKFLGEGEVPFVVNGLVVPSRFYIWKPLDREVVSEKSCSLLESL